MLGSAAGQLGGSLHNMDEERKARLENVVHTANFGPGDRGRKKS